MLRIQLNQPKPTFEQRLVQEAHRVKERAKTLPHGKERELLSLKARLVCAGARARPPVTGRPRLWSLPGDTCAVAAIRLRHLIGWLLPLPIASCARS
jgi:hypothetical protein